MKRILLLTLFPCLLGLSSCKVFNPQSNKAQTALVYAKPVAYLATKSVFDLAVSPEDKAKKAEIVRKVATSIRSLSSGELPTPEQLHLTIMGVAPDKTHWNDFAVALTQAYQGYYEQIVTGDIKAKYIADILNKIASGCEEAVEQML